MDEIKIGNVEGGTVLICDVICWQCGVAERLRIQMPYRCHRCIEVVIEGKREQRFREELEWEKQHPIKSLLGIRKKEE